MKKFYYLIILTVILGLVLTGCLLSNVGQVPTSEQSGITYLTKGPLSINLVGLWHLDEEAGDIAYDSSGHDNDGTVNGAIWDDGKFDNALSFDGSNDYVKVFDSASLNVTDYTIELCINANNFDNVYPTLLNHKVQKATEGYYWIWIKDGYIVLTYSDGTKARSKYWSASFSTGEWHHIALTKSGSSFTMYKDGSSLGTKILTYVDAVDGDLFIGTYQGSTVAHYNFDGLIDEVRIWDKALTAKQIEDSFNHGIVIQKGMSEDDLFLGDTVTITLEVVTAHESVTITDKLPDELHYIPGTFEVDGDPDIPEVDKQTISFTLGDPCAYTITFDAQVTSVEATLYTVENIATADGASASAELTIHPYEGFTKDALLRNDEGDEDGIIEVGEEIKWDVTIIVENILNDAILDMNNIVVQDRFGGELEIDDGYEVPEGSFLEVTVSGKTDKPKIKWDNFSLSDGEFKTANLLVSTDVNPGGLHSYSTAGEYEMNSGAVLKFTDPGTGFQLSAHTPQITVEVFEQPE
jgi:hypothetical protein